MLAGKLLRLAVCAAVALACLAGWTWAGRGGVVCVNGTLGEALQRTVATLDTTIDLGIKLSISLVAVGSAVLLGLKSGIRLTAWIKTVLFTSVVLFGQSAFAGVVWKLKVANGWMNECLNLVAEQQLQRMFNLAYGFFLIGLVFTLIMVGVAVTNNAGTKERQDET